jgi:preprotein translocase subunit SecD
VIGVLIFSLFVDGAGYVYRVVNHYPLTGSVPGLPPNFNGWQLYTHYGLDLKGGTDIQLQLTDFPPGQDRASVQSRFIDVIQKRVNALGVSEPTVQPGGGGNHDRVEVQLPGVGAPQALQLLGRRDKLVVTKWVPDPSMTNTALPFPGYKPQITPLTSDMLTNAYAGLNPQTSVGWVVNFQYNSQGAGIFNQLTTDAYSVCQSQGPSAAQCHITNWLDLTPDDIAQWNTRGPDLYRPVDAGGHLVSDPQIANGPIPSGQGYIEGNFSQDTAKNLSILLNSGSLPVNFSVLQSSQVGASLGAQSIKLSVAAALLGLCVVIVFMIAFYRLPGLLASLALLCYAGVALAVFKMVPVTLTLAGLAGFILSVGMAVDANVLIFERFKEEMRAGRTIGAAVDAAVRRAWPAIRDSNTSTLITSLVLIFAAPIQVKGFAVTLAIGVVISLVSAIIITHNLLAIVLNFGWARASSLMGVARG